MKVKARFHESMIYIAGRPIQFTIARLMRFKSITYLPFVDTYFINNPIIGKQILKDVENFSSSGVGSMGGLVSDVMGNKSIGLFNIQGEEHHDLKFKLLSIFQPDYIDSIVKETLNSEVKELKKRIKNKEIIDLVPFIKRCTARVTCHMLGIMSDDPNFESLLLKVAKLCDELTSLMSVSSSQLSPKKRNKAKKLYNELCSIIKIYYDKPINNDKCVIYKLKERGFSFKEAKSLLVVIMAAGTETVSSSFPRIIALLLDDERWGELQNNKNLLEGAIQEGLRFTAPASLIFHSTIDDSTLGSYRFKKNRRVLIMLLNILRSDRYFPNAYTLDFERVQDERYRYFWFGAGPHFCLGSELAKKELRTITKALLENSDHPKIVKRSYAKGTSFPGYRTLLVDFNS
jgi:cytochrome P450